MNNHFVYKYSIENLSKLIKEKNAKNLLLFTGKKSFELIKPIINEQLVNVKFTCINDFSNNPKMDEVDEKIKKYGSNYDLFVAIGGGSVIDFAKLYKFKTNKTKILIAIPTTAGTGAEVTKFAVVYIEGVKHSIESDEILPNYAIVDSQFIENVPKSIKISCGLDAFCQGIESFWSVNSTVQSLKFAKEAIELCRDNFVDYVNNSNENNSKNMAKASYLAGKAINISKTTASHALSYKFTSEYGITHGCAVALSIANLMKYNLKIDEKTCNDSRGVEYVRNKMKELREILKIQNETEYFKNLFNSIGFDFNLEHLGVKDINLIIKSVDKNRLKNNPKCLTDEELNHIFD